MRRRVKSVVGLDGFGVAANKAVGRADYVVNDEDCRIDINNNDRFALMCIQNQFGHGYVGVYSQEEHMVL